LTVKSSAIPQARSLDTVRQVVLCASTGRVDREALAAKTNLSLRHVGYHLNAAVTLRWLAADGDSYSLTQSGRELLDTTPQSQKEAIAFATAIAHSPEINSIAPELANPDARLDLRTIAKSIEHAAGLSYSTAEARAQTLIAWRKRIERALRGSAQISLPIHTDAIKTSTLFQVSMQNWKSFESAILDIEPLTIMIGANASGKSNALDALVLLQRLAAGNEIRTALSGGPSSDPVRGGVEWSARAGRSQFTLGVLVASSDNQYTYRYSVSIETSPQVRLCAEMLERLDADAPRKQGISLFRTDAPLQGAPSLIVRLYNTKAGTKQEVGRSTLVLRQLAASKTRREIRDGILAIQDCLRSILVLDPVPSRMRGYSPLADLLEQDGSNAAGVLAALEPEKKAKIERTLSDYARKLPERGIESLWTEKVGKFNADAMLYARERWADDGSPIEIDSRGMSDGTLRFVAILTALLTQPPGSILVVEEIDNGFHPARTSLLLETLKTIGKNRRLDVIVTTHNQALLDAVGPDLIPSVVVAHRQTPSGASTLTVLDDLQDLPRLLAGSRLGKAAATGQLELLLRRSGQNR
jgi:predicted ATPase